MAYVGASVKRLDDPRLLTGRGRYLDDLAQNKVITSQYRAVGHPIAAAVTEGMLDLAARDLGLDPAEIRRRNLIRPEELPWGPSSRDAGPRAGRRVQGRRRGRHDWRAGGRPQRRERRPGALRRRDYGSADHPRAGAEGASPRPIGLLMPGRRGR